MNYLLKKRSIPVPTSVQGPGPGVLPWEMEETYLQQRSQCHQSTAHHR